MQTETKVPEIDGLQELFAGQESKIKTQVDALLSDWTAKQKAAYSMDGGASSI